MERLLDGQHELRVRRVRVGGEAAELPQPHERLEPVDDADPRQARDGRVPRQRQRALRRREVAAPRPRPQRRQPPSAGAQHVLATASTAATSAATAPP